MDYSQAIQLLRDTANATGNDKFLEIKTMLEVREKACKAAKSLMCDFPSKDDDHYEQTRINGSWQRANLKQKIEQRIVDTRVLIDQLKAIP